MPLPDKSFPAGSFHATRWTLVLRARGGSDEGRAALSELCAAYYEPVQQFLRREGCPSDAVRDLAHEFFARLLRCGDIGAPDPERGRFRSWLLGAVKHFAADVRKSARREKRGGGRDPLPLHEECGAEALAQSDERTPGDAFFDREWAVAVMNRAVTALEREYAATGRADEFALLKGWITGGPAGSQAEAGEAAGISAAAVKAAVFRLRSRFRELLRMEIRQTVQDAGDVEAEWRHLLAALQAG